MMPETPEMPETPLDISHVPIETQLAHDGALVTDFLASYFAEIQSPAKQLVDGMRYASLNGGKRIRAGLSLAAGRLVAPQNERALQHAIAGASALEMIHAYSLVHDDLPAMDDAETRRGKPALHIAFDEATAILAGGALQTEAFVLLASQQVGFTPETAIRLVRELAIGASADGMAGGQMLDLMADDLATSNKGFGVSETEQMQAMKTGALIVAAPVMGAIAAGALEDVIDDLRAFATPLGIAFQVADDVLDVTADGAKMGKPVGRDKEQGKASFVDFYGLEGAKTYATDLVEKSCDILAPYGEKASPLQKIAQFVINRSY